MINANPFIVREHDGWLLVGSKVARERVKSRWYGGGGFDQWMQICKNRGVDGWTVVV